MDKTKLTIEAAAADINSGAQNLVIRALINDLATARVHIAELEDLVRESTEVVKKNIAALDQHEKNSADSEKVAADAVTVASAVIYPDRGGSAN